MTTNLRKWGNSYGIRIPKDVVDRLGIRDGSEVKFDIQPVKKKVTIDDLVEQIDPQTVPKFIDWGPDVGSEKW